MSDQPPRTGDDLRAAYLRFFEERGHLLLPSASLIPAGDPTLLLNSAGMVPFKPYYSGEETPPSKRVTSCQKCFRTTDIDEVGDHTHLTMFEMLGNFSFGDYFKSEASAWAWEFVTEVLGLSPAHLWVTVHDSDDEARAIWRDEIGLPNERIFDCGDKDNFWGPAGDEGACGPCSEIHYDLRPDEPPVSPCADDSGRFVEIWNLVFPQFYQHKDGTRTNLPATGIDTGLGLERLAAIMQGVPSAYETDLLRPIVATVEEIAGKHYGENEETDTALRVVTEHARSATFLISDGVVPANEGRGYVLRRVIRRGIRYARRLGIQDPFLVRVAEAVIARMATQYPELPEHQTFVLKTLASEEERFDEAIAQGMPVLEEMLQAGGAIAGRDAFLLYDTFGFPLDLTQEVAREHGVDVDVAGFEDAMEEQRQRGRSAAQFGGGRDMHRMYEALGVNSSEFLGYDTLEADAVVVGIMFEGRSAERADAGDAIELIIDRTPFYPEGGGQMGDTGVIAGEGFMLDISDTRKPAGDLIAHHAVVREGTVEVGNPVYAAVDREHRLDVARNHTATHLLHAALRDVLGTHVRQAGSLVAPDHLRFDFTHVAAVSPEELTRIEDAINTSVRDDLALVKGETTYREATATGALAFFGERYGDRVRTVQIGEETPVSFEVCGGTHLDRTGQIGWFHVTSESSVGTGVRRIEAVTGRGSERWLHQQLGLLNEVATKLRSNPADAPHRIDSLLLQAEEARKASAAGQREASLREAEDLLGKAQDVGGVTVLAVRSGASDMEAVRATGDWLRDKLGSAVVVLAAVLNDRPTLVAMVTQDLVDKGLDAGAIVRAGGKPIGGGGGGRPQLAQAGGKDASKLDEALEAAVAAVREQAG